MIKVKHSPYIICSLFACLSLTGCIKDLEGKNSLIRQIAEPPGVNCSAGGYKVVTGLDDNRNGELDDNEIQETSYVCGGNKETILSFSDDIGYWTTSVHGGIPRTLGIDNFNITNYQADSVSFTCYMSTSDPKAKAIIELYDMTNDKVIDYSLIMSNTVTPTLSVTPLNFISNIPKSYIKLGCRIRTEKEGIGIEVRKIALKLYKR